MEIGTAIECIVKKLGLEVLCNKKLFCNCLEDVMPNINERDNTFLIIYDDKIGGILYLASGARIENLFTFKKEIVDNLIKRGMSDTYCEKFVGYFNWIFDARKSIITKQNDSICKNSLVIHSSKKMSEQKDSLKNVQIGYCVEFGRYPYWQQGRAERIVWRVLDIREDSALLISNKVIDYMPLSNTIKCFSWKDCFLSTWLNSVFYVNAFNHSEMANIVFNKEVDSFVTIPSIKEMKLYYSDNQKSNIPTFSTGKAKALQTPYVANKNSDSIESRYVKWWLRDFNVGEGRAKYVSSEGRVIEPGCDGGVVKARGVRPMIWVKIC